MFCDETNGPNQETDRRVKKEKMRSRAVDVREGRGQGDREIGGRSYRTTYVQDTRVWSIYQGTRLTLKF